MIDIYICKKDEFKRIFSSEELSVDDECYDKFSRYAEILTERNKVMNLTAITDPQGINEKHFLDSVLIFKYCDIPENSSVIDVGTGAGFPGLAMKIYRPDIKLTLLDSLQKRVCFLEDAVNFIPIEAECIHMRAEDGGRNPKLREKFDVVTARAVAALPVLAEYCLPFVTVGGQFIAMKGPNEDILPAENAIKQLGGKIDRTVKYSLPCGDDRTIIIIKKLTATPTKFPRSSAQISKKSL
ncbi:MAG: 16S rRNA (guanine(527)-N(7))-methyltransferase RsmG [Oscillospiraceae bacterium]|nr:16S rRNA (guanine(527)-N(7))-methyltransferase RsmG [Oscillospiraceae bacterium]